MHWGNQTIFSVHAHTASLVRTRGTMYGGFGSRFGLIGFEEIVCAETSMTMLPPPGEHVPGTLGGPRDLENRNVSHTRNTQVTGHIMPHATRQQSSRQDTKD